MPKLTKELQDFVNKYSWEQQMSRSQGFDSSENYSGPSLGDKVVVIGQSRDSDILEQSNFTVALDRLGGESKHVGIHRFGHWGCGWFELILVSPKSVKYLKIAKQIKEALADYPVLDESDYFEREYDYQSEYAEQAKDELAEALSKHFAIENNRELVKIAFELTMANQSYYGNDSCVNIYTVRKPDTNDIKEMKVCMEQVDHTFKDSHLFSRLWNNVNKRLQEVA